jgi:putative hydrolase of the HAD superfamily
MRCTFIYFDIGFTLLRPVPSVGFHYAEAAARHGLVVQAEHLDAAFVPAWRAARKAAAISDALPYGRNLEEALQFWTVVVREVFANAGYKPLPEDSPYYREVFDHFARGECWALYPDVEEALAILEGEGIPFGALSNFDPRIRQILEETGLGPRLSRIITSSEVGAEKPDPAIFRHAREVLKPHEAARIALIGDEPEADGHGAHRAGWQQCLVLRGGQAAAEPPLCSESTLPAAVRRLLL